MTTWKKKHLFSVKLHFHRLVASHITSFQRPGIAFCLAGFAVRSHLNAVLYDCSSLIFGWGFFFLPYSKTFLAKKFPWEFKHVNITLSQPSCSCTFKKLYLKRGCLKLSLKLQTVSVLWYVWDLCGFNPFLTEFRWLFSVVLKTYSTSWKRERCTYSQDLFKAVLGCC